MPRARAVGRALFIGIREENRLDGVYAVLARMPLFDGVPREAFEMEPLGSLTNFSYKVTIEGRSYALRLPGRGTGEYIDRAAEEYNTRAAAIAGVGVEVLFFDESDGTMLGPFIEGKALSAERLKTDPEALIRATLALRRIHRFGQPFMRRFDVFATLGYYRELASKLGARLPEDIGRLMLGARDIRRALEAAPVVLAPCHNDPWAENFIDDGRRIYIIDWEYSGMNDPMWDLADLSIEAGFGPAQDLAMLRAYCGGRIPPALRARLVLYKPLSDLLWSLWALVQHANSNTAQNFASYALDRYERCRMGMSDPDLGQSLALLRKRAMRGAQVHNPKKKLRPAEHPVLPATPRASAFDHPVEGTVG